jgi:hypothetical protein
MILQRNDYKYGAREHKEHDDVGKKRTSEKWERQINKPNQNKAEYVHQTY